MKCVSYDYDFENDLATEWKALDSPAPQPSEDEDEAPTGRLRDHLSRRAKCKKSAYQEDSASDEGGKDLYNDADVGDSSEY